MLFEKKIKRVIDVEKTEREYGDTEREPLEKGDGAALVIAALLVFIPLFAVFGAAIYGLVWVFTRG